MTSLKNIKILDTTLRDGSYAVNFSFTCNQTKIICKNLQESGIQLIEIGHGTGLNSSNKGFGKSAQTDEEYMQSANEVLNHSKFGMFCIPGIAELENIDLAAKHEMGFLRIGTDVTRVEESKEFIKRAKDHGMYVAANYMKSYAMKPEKFAQKVLLSESYGADIVYVVDSAGGMFPQDIENYFKEINKISNIPLGFHGHDNLGLGISNSLTAIDLGAKIVDSSLQGLGRSSGNASTEILILALLKRGYEINIDFFKLLELGQNIIQPLIPFKGRNPLDTISGFADFHSSYMPKILEYASKFDIEPLKLIIEITKIDKIDVNDDILERAAKKINLQENKISTRFDPSWYIGGEQ